MPACTNFGHSKARLNKGDLCTECFNIKHKKSVRLRSINAGVISNPSLDINDTENALNDIVSIDEQETMDDTLDDALLNTPLSNISVADLLKIIKQVIKPIDDKLDHVIKSYGSKINALDTKVKLLECDLESKEE